MINRRQFMALSGIALATPALSKLAIGTERSSKPFPKGFLFGAASAGHQVEGNNVNADIWLFENVQPTVFRQRSGDACNSFELWETDLDLCKNMGLSAYRFSIEWARIEPSPGHFSIAMLDHYKRIIEGCHARDLAPLVTFNHFASPIWFGAMGGWTNPDAPAIFARYCRKAAEHLADGIHTAVTFNEPNLLRLLRVIGVPPFVWDLNKKMLEAAAAATNSKYFSGLNAARIDDLDKMNLLLIEGHKQGREAIKSVRSNLDVGFTLAMLDDQATGKNSLREQKREENYGEWLRAAQHSDFIGVQNYERMVWDDKGHVPTPDDVQKNFSGSWVDPTSLANCVQYTFEQTGKPILVSEHGIGTTDDKQRAWFITESLRELQKVMDKGVPVNGYVHWTLLDNFEWIHGYEPKFGLHSVDLTTFERKSKPSAYVYGKIAQQHGL
jgi:beta-glucosidase